MTMGLRGMGRRGGGTVSVVTLARHVWDGCERIEVTPSRLQVFVVSLGGGG